MALDASIFARFTQPLRSVADYDREFYDAQNAKQAGQLNQLQLLAGQRREAEAQRAIAEQEGVRNALAQLGVGAGDEQRINALSALGTPTGLGQADTLKKAALERNKTQAEVGLKSAQADKERLAAGLQRFEIVGQIMGGVRDQASYDAARQQAVAQFGPEFASRMAPVYDPAAIAQAQQQAMSVKERLEQEWKAKGYDLQMAQQGETARHNQAGEKNAAGHLGIAQGQLGVSRARLAQDAATPKGQVVQTDQGLMLVDPRTGSGKPVTDPDGKPLAGGVGAKPLPQAVTKQLTEVRDNAATIDRLATSFKPGFAGKGVLGLGADAQLGAAGTLGVDSEAVEWWKQYRKQAELVERHALFGAALTPTEQASWRSADIGPGMNAKTIATNLATRKTLAAKVLDNTRQDLIDAGHSDKRINAISSRGQEGAAPASGGWSVVEVKK